MGEESVSVEIADKHTLTTKDYAPSGEAALSEGDVMTENPATTRPPLGKILTADEIARFVARVAYSTSPVVLIDEDMAVAAPARTYGDSLDALGLPDLAEKSRTHLPERGAV